MCALGAANGEDVAMKKVGVAGKFVTLTCWRILGSIAERTEAAEIIFPNFAASIAKASFLKTIKSKECTAVLS